MIPPQLIVFGILALIRLSRAADKAAAQFARDRSVALPALDLPALNNDNKIKLAISDEERDRVIADAELGPLWKIYDGGAPGDHGFEEAKARMLMEAAGILAREMPGTKVPRDVRSGDLGAAILVGQWREGTGPAHPLAGFALAVLDVGLEFVALEPSVLGVRKGEKLIGAFAKNLSLFVDSGRQLQGSFAQEVLATFLRASLTTLQENANLAVSDKDWAKLVENTLPPIIAALPERSDDALDLKLRRLADALLGPAFKAAVTTIAESPAAFLGDAAKIDSLPGVVIGAILEQGKTQDLTKQFSEAGISALVRAILGAMAAHPQHLVQAGQHDKGAEVAREILKQVLKTLSDSWPGTPFAGDLGLRLAAAALTGVKNSAGTLFDQSKPWEALAQRFLVEVVGGMADGFKKENLDLAGLASTDRLLELGRVFLEQVAKTPAMVSGKNPGIRAVAAAIAAAMAKDKGLLLGHDDWLEIARVAAAEAAANPGRLFALPDGGGTTLASALIDAIFTAVHVEAAAMKEKNKSEGNALLFGATLRELVVHTLSSAAGNFAKLAEVRNVGTVEGLLARIVKLTSAEPEKYGSKELLRLYKLLLPEVLATGVIPELTPEKIVAALTGGGK